MPKSELIKVKGSSHYFGGNFSVGAFLIEGKYIVLFDSGVDDETAGDLINTINEKGFEVIAIINTHRHADHCGGNRYFQNNIKGLRIYASDGDAPFINNPRLETTALYANATPIKEMSTNKFLEAPSSVVTDVIPCGKQALEIRGVTFQILPLPGHTAGMIGIITPDNVLYCGDALYGSHVFNRHVVSLYNDITQALRSLEMLKTLSVDSCVMYHGGLVSNMASLCDSHIERIRDIETFVLATIRKSPVTFDDLTKAVMDHYKQPNTIMKFILVRATIHAYVSHLEETAGIKLTVQEGMLKISSGLAPQPAIAHIRSTL